MQPETHRLLRRSTCMPPAGMTLIELMIGLAIGLFLVLMVVHGTAATSASTNVNSLVSEYQANGRHALEELKREVRHAALRPMVWDSNPKYFVVNATVSSRNFGCGAGVSAGALPGIAASNDANVYANTCLAAGNDREWARGDVLVLRRAERNAASAYDANAPYVRVSYGQGNVFLGGEAPANYLPPVADYRLLNEVYFVNAFTNSPDETPRVPALYRLRLSEGANPTMVPELVASNVEHFQVQFGEVTDSATGSVRYVNAASVGDWERVNSARIWLLLRATAPEPGFASGSYQIGDVTYTPNDQFRRAVITSTINLRNL